MYDRTLMHLIHTRGPRYQLKAEKHGSSYLEEINPQQIVPFQFVSL